MKIKVKTVFQFYLKLFLLAVILRLCFLGMIFWIFRDSMNDFLSRSDGGSYLHVAQQIFFGSQAESPATPYDTRVFLGWPLMFGWGSFIVRGEFVMFGLLLVLSGLVPCLFHGLTHNRPLSMLLCFFTPAWLLHSVHPMGEAAYLFWGLLSILMMQERRPWIAGIALGWMISIRPYAVVLAFAFTLSLLRYEKAYKHFIYLFLGSLLLPVGSLILNHAMYGDILHQFHMYGKHLGELNLTPAIVEKLGNPSGHWGFPLYHVLTTPWKVTTPIWKTVYIYSHVAMILGVTWIGLRSVRSWQKWDPLDGMMHFWFFGNTVLILCSGPYWGFHSFDRYCVWALPAMLWMVRKYLPLPSPQLAILGLMSLGVVAFSLVKCFR
jgi:hypothetical protein